MGPIFYSPVSPLSLSPPILRHPYLLSQSVEELLTKSNRCFSGPKKENQRNASIHLSRTVSHWYWDRKELVSCKSWMASHLNNNSPWLYHYLWNTSRALIAYLESYGHMVSLKPPTHPMSVQKMVYPIHDTHIGDIPYWKFNPDTVEWYNNILQHILKEQIRADSSKNHDGTLVSNSSNP